MSKPTVYHFLRVVAAMVLALVLGLVWRAGLFSAAPVVTDPRATAAAALRAAHASITATDSRLALGDLKKALRQMHAAVAARLLLRELEHGDDFTTHLEFSIGTGQQIKEWPSYRVFLLDMLMLVDPAAAVVTARDILRTSGSADEWAVALRNLARGGTAAADTAMLKQKSAEMLHNTAWRAAPTTAYLQAFDVIVHTANTDLVPDLAGLCDDRDQRAVRHAAFLTLDRLALAKPELVLPMLGQQAGSHPQSGLMISNMIARGDLRDAAQRLAVENYLLDERRTTAELQGFASVFPNASMTVSDNLLTHSAAIDGADLAAKDRASLDIVAAWLSDAAFARSHAMLLETYKRLQQFVERR